MTLRICIDARMPDAAAGGIQQLVIGLATGLARLGTSDRYFFLADAGAERWLAPHLPSGAAIVVAPSSHGKIGLVRQMVTLPGVRSVWRHVGARSGPLALKVPPSDGTIERLGADVMHFTWQRGFLTDVPSIYHPHDLQHVHLPMLLSRRERAGRDVLYGTLAQQAEIVAVSSEWARQDMIRHLGLAESKVRVVPLAPATEAYPKPTVLDIAAARDRLRLPDTFFFYPAQTWPHKNHLRLVEAIARLREEGVSVSLVCSGALNDHHRKIVDLADRLGVQEQVRFVGFVSAIELQALYRLARAVIIPTRFEAASFPLWEAFLAGTPAACSTVTSLPEQADDAALLFDPDDVVGMAGAMRRLWLEEPLRAELAARGRMKVSQLSWVATAARFHAIYQEIAASRSAPN